MYMTLSHSPFHLPCHFHGIFNYWGHAPQSPTVVAGSYCEFCDFPDMISGCPVGHVSVFLAFSVLPVSIRRQKIWGWPPQCAPDRGRGRTQKVRGRGYGFAEAAFL